MYGSGEQQEADRVNAEKRNEEDKKKQTGDLQLLIVNNTGRHFNYTQLVQISFYCF